MKIFITGNMGYVGSCLVEQLRKTFPTAILVGCDVGFFAERLAVKDAKIAQKLSLKLDVWLKNEKAVFPEKNPNYVK